jgi:fatty acid-binding protein DegV
MGAEDGSILQIGQGIGMKKGLAKMAEAVVKDSVNPEGKRLMITHVNNPKGAESLKKQILDKINVKETIIMDARGVSSMYANDGGVIVTL